MPGRSSMKLQLRGDPADAWCFLGVRKLAERDEDGVFSELAAVRSRSAASVAG